MQRNEAAFDIKSWAEEKVGATIWQGIMDYSRVDLSKVKEKLKKNAIVGRKALRQFDSI